MAVFIKQTFRKTQDTNLSIDHENYSLNYKLGDLNKNLNKNLDEMYFEADHENSGSLSRN